jgi:hypothetical protein
VLVYHGVQSENTPRCASQTTTACVGDYDTTASQFQAQLDYISATGLASDVMTVRQALQDAGSQTQPPQAGTVKITPTQPTTNATVTATATGFTGPQGAALAYTYVWKVDGVVMATATSAGATATFDLRSRATATTETALAAQSRPTMAKAARARR